MPVVERHDIRVTITPAVRTPITTPVSAYLKLRPMRNAAIEPVQAPVIGKGSATKIARPSVLYFSTIRERDLVCENNQSKKRLKGLHLERNLEKGPRNNKIKIAGIRLPITDII